MKIHIFNPDTDYALANPLGNYNPPASVVNLRRKMALFPAVYSKNDEAILTIDRLDDGLLGMTCHYDVAMRKNIKIISLEDIPSAILDMDDGNSIAVEPWGWNMSLRNLLLRHGMHSGLLKSESQIENIRRLSHRHTTIPFQHEISQMLPKLSLRSACEFQDVDQALSFANDHPGAYFKMPWSSSGRGVICSSGMSRKKLSEWIRGAIARQGSVMGEHGYDRVADFATEWRCRGGEVEFAGLSWFSTSSNGNYLGNAQLPQNEIWHRIKEASPWWSQDIIVAQKHAVRKLIAPYYDGPLGIDMLADREGNVNPCVEINIRMTMGMAAILSNQ